MWLGVSAVRLWALLWGILPTPTHIMTENATTGHKIAVIGLDFNVVDLVDARERLDGDDLIRAVLRFQVFARLEVTGTNPVAAVHGKELVPLCQLILISEAILLLLRQR